MQVLTLPCFNNEINLKTVGFLSKPEAKRKVKLSLALIRFLPKRVEFGKHGVTFTSYRKIYFHQE